jgi:hypothetical protein
MADSQKLISWLLDNSEKLQLQATELTWVQEWNLSGVFDYQVEITIQDRIYKGRGTALTEELAFVKAGAEAIERAFCGGYGISSLGVAAHTDQVLAEKNAASELNERDAFFNHYYLKRSLDLLEDSKIHNFKNRWQSAFKKLATNRVDCQFFEAESDIESVVVCVMSGEKAQQKFGGIIGLGSNQSIDAALESAFLEALRNAASVLQDEGSEPFSINDFLNIEKPNSLDRQRLAMNVEYWSGVKNIFPLKAATATVFKRPTASVIFQNLICPFKELTSAPVVVCRAHFENDGTKLIRPYDKSPTTWARLQNYSKNKLTEADIENRPHFLG